MPYPAKDIIAYLQEKYPAQREFTVTHGSDLDLAEHFTFVFQFILGVTRKDPYHNDISHYKQYMQKFFANAAPVECPGWPYESDEVDELRDALMEIAAYLHVDIDIDKMFQRENVRKNSKETYYLVVTVAQYRLGFIH